MPRTMALACVVRRRQWRVDRVHQLPPSAGAVEHGPVELVLRERVAFCMFRYLSGGWPDQPILAAIVKIDAVCTSCCVSPSRSIRTAGSPISDESLLRVWRT